MGGRRRHHPPAATAEQPQSSSSGAQLPMSGRSREPRGRAAGRSASSPREEPGLLISSSSWGARLRQWSPATGGCEPGSRRAVG